MKLQDGMLVKRKDNGLKGVAHKIQGSMWKVKYHDGTHTYTTDSKLEKLFVIPEVEVSFEDDSNEYLHQSDDVVTKYLEKEAHKICSDLIDNQEHYTNNGIQPIEIMKANMNLAEYQAFLLGNVWKYTMRYKDKNGLQDIKKAKTYLTWLEADIEERGL